MIIRRGLISNDNFQVTLSKETGCEEKILFVWSSLSFTFPLNAQKFISRKISPNTVQLDLSPNCLLQMVRNRKKLTRRKFTNVDECLMEHWNYFFKFRHGKGENFCTSNFLLRKK